MLAGRCSQIKLSEIGILSVLYSLRELDYQALIL
jgi:hypothetical protein